MPKNSIRVKSQKGKAKVKSGCRTCKIRKVKCDEGRPVCERCATTGRVCDGYGIWGGGGNSYGNRQCLVKKDSLAVPHLSISFSVLSSGTAEEKSYFEIFKCKTSIKLPGSFVSKFWNTLVFQSSYGEPAVLHAVLALSSAHQNGNTKIKEQFTLHQYLKAITHLQPHFLSKDRDSTRIALITCILFVCLEFLRGHFATAQIHLQNGLKVLTEVGIVTNELDQTLSSSSRNKSTDDWIVEAFSRLHLQLELFKYGYQHPCLVLQTAKPSVKTSEFHSIDEAWRGLEPLFNETFNLTHQCRQQETLFGAGCSNNPALFSQQQTILTSLENWLKTFKTSEINIPNRKPHEGAQAFQLLNSYHTLCLIMTSTSLRPTFESIFDTQLANFQLLISQLVAMREISSEHLLQEERLDMPRSIIDMGWIPLLYFTATKCRDHWIRRQAIGLLESVSHREGIWDSRITTCVARKVVEMEEREFYTSFDLDHFSLGGDFHSRDMELPTLPLSYRLREVEMVLLGSPMDRIQLFGKEEREGVDYRVLLSEYDVDLQCWTDKRALGLSE